jgi:hypothetical protein
MGRPSPVCRPLAVRPPLVWVEAVRVLVAAPPLATGMKARVDIGRGIREGSVVLISVRLRRLTMGIEGQIVDPGSARD